MRLRESAKNVMVVLEESCPEMRSISNVNFRHRVCNRFGRGRVGSLAHGPHYEVLLIVFAGAGTGCLG